MMAKYLSKKFLDSITLSQKMESLRNIVFYVHNLADFFLDALLIDEILIPVQKKLTEKENLALSETLNTMLLEIDLVRKLKLNKRNKFISKIKKELEEINTLRNWFSHPRVYFEEIDKLQKDAEQLRSKTNSFRRVMISLINYWLDTDEDIDKEVAAKKKIEKLRDRLEEDVER